MGKIPLRNMSYIMHQLNSSCHDEYMIYYEQRAESGWMKEDVYMRTEGGAQATDERQSKGNGNFGIHICMY